MSETYHGGDPLYDLRHSTAHLMAQAVGELFPDVKYAIGPPIQDGFYYDFDLSEPIREEDLPRIEAKMREISGRNLKIEREEMPREAARSFEEEQGQPYKVELINSRWHMVSPTGGSTSYFSSLADLEREATYELNRLAKA